MWQDWLFEIHAQLIFTSWVNWSNMEWRALLKETTIRRESNLWPNNRELNIFTTQLCAFTVTVVKCRTEHETTFYKPTKTISIASSYLRTETICTASYRSIKTIIIVPSYTPARTISTASSYWRIKTICTASYRPIKTITQSLPTHPQRSKVQLLHSNKNHKHSSFLQTYKD